MVNSTFFISLPFQLRTNIDFSWHTKNRTTASSKWTGPGVQNHPLEQPLTKKVKVKLGDIRRPLVHQEEQINNPMKQ